MVGMYQIVAARMAAAALAGAAVLAGCDRPADRSATANVVTAGEGNDGADAILPVAEPPLDREALLILAMRAANREALGMRDGVEQRSLDGKLFEWRIRFGCEGPVEGKQPDLGWSVDSAKSTLRLRAAPDVEADDPLVQATGGKQGFEAVEGFWIPRPWLLAAACPVRSKPPAAPATQEPAGPTNDVPGSVKERAAGRIGIAQFFSPADSRTHRRSGRAYEAVVNLEPDGQVAGRGFNLILSGRLRALADGRVIACASPDPDRRPDCIIAVAINEVRMERPDGGAVLARWDAN